MRYGYIENQKVFLMDNATSKLKKDGFTCVQSLLNGGTAIVRTELIKNIEVL